MSWHYPPELPKDGEAVIADFGGNDCAMFEYSYNSDAEGRVWSVVETFPMWCVEQKMWVPTDGRWDDQYDPIRWHRFPNPEDKQ